jgi:hemerythrin-like metal-binding protein
VIPDQVTRIAADAAHRLIAAAAAARVTSNTPELIMDIFFEWDPGKYGLDVPDMDAEHQTLIGLMNSLHRLHQAGAGTPALAKSLGEFLKFTVKHFADEEAYMARIDYPDLRVHAGVHKQLLARVGEFHTEFLRTGKLTDAFFMFLKTWLKAHICGIDAKYGNRSRRVA